MSDPVLTGRKILIAVSGGIATYKVAEAARLFKKRGADIRVMMTEAATRFVHPTTFSTITGNRVGLDLFNETGEPQVDHLDMPHWADVILVAPATANLISKLACGIADNLVSTALLAARCPIVFAPAMNTSMLENPAIKENLKTLKKRGYIQVGPDSGDMASPGEQPGPGRMSEPEEIESVILRLLAKETKLSGKNIVITAGRTEENIDPVRVLTNRSSGRMGIALANAAHHMGADVTLVHGAMEVLPPDEVNCIPVISARDMLKACTKAVPTADIVIYAAAVADWRPKSSQSKKGKRSKSDAPVIELVENPDVAKETSKLGKGLKIGFALENEDKPESAKKKLKAKNLDGIFLNILSAMGSPDNKLTWIPGDGKIDKSKRAPKDKLAEWALDRIAGLLEN